MFLILQREDETEPKRWRYDAKKLMSAEREMLERRTERAFDEFQQDVIKGSTICRRALLFMFLKRDHPGVKYEDVDFAWDELKLEFSKPEYAEMIAQVSENLNGAERDAAMNSLAKEMETAYEDADESGKAPSPADA